MHKLSGTPNFRKQGEAPGSPSGVKSQSERRGEEMNRCEKRKRLIKSSVFYE
jgi:hypothetical protein